MKVTRYDLDIIVSGGAEINAREGGEFVDFEDYDNRVPIPNEQAALAMWDLMEQSTNSQRTMGNVQLGRSDAVELAKWISQVMQMRAITQEDADKALEDWLSIKL